MICSQRAEIDKMGRAMHDGAKLVHEFKTQLTAAQAEIAQLEIEADKDAAKLGAQETLLREVYAEFEAKLTNLRAAEERLVDALDAGMSCEKALGETSAAIEASK
jgi:flagellin-like hook-associated protein FlgL